MYRTTESQCGITETNIGLQVSLLQNQPYKLIEKKIRLLLTEAGDERRGNWMKAVKRHKLSVLTINQH